MAWTVDRRIRKGSITEASASGDFKINMVSTEVSNLQKQWRTGRKKKGFGNCSKVVGSVTRNGLLESHDSITSLKKKKKKP